MYLVKSVSRGEYYTNFMAMGDFSNGDRRKKSPLYLELISTTIFSDILLASI